ncbi:unnamed protein product [Hydatigera taeniaeformis]|uniref:Unconventional prefoldin RPB5 interactor 1 n=1 Tax=Hydatigena taeniaeformis TaxID=6205 RepID=A0A0R3X2K4_HYDTA|nr:unnamed protein product [Hydatigera taeniaeformis]
MDRFDRLLEEQQKAIGQTDDSIGKLQAYVDEYARLKTRLLEVSNCFSRKAIIPFSPRALVPARLIHTNEVLVYLGGCAEHFSEVSTSQSLLIIDERIKRIQNKIQKLKEQKRLLSDRVSYTQRLVRGQQPQSVTEGDEGVEFEIREEFDPVKEKEWQAKHKRRVLTERMRERDCTPTGPSLSPKLGSHDAISSEHPSPPSPDIVVCSSTNQARPVVSYIREWCKASPADVVATIQKGHQEAESKGVLKSTHLRQLPATHEFCEKSGTESEPTSKSSKYPIEPFSQVIERASTSIEAINSTGSNGGHISQFRAKRNRNL